MTTDRYMALALDSKLHVKDHIYYLNPLLALCPAPRGALWLSNEISMINELIELWTRRVSQNRSCKNLNGLAVLMLRAGHFEAALSTIEIGNNLDERYGTLVNRAQIFLQLNHFDAAEQDLQEATSLGWQGGVLAKFLLAKLFLLRGKNSKAHNLLKSLLDCGVNSSEVILEMLKVESSPLLKRSYLLQARLINSNDPKVTFKLGELYEEDLQFSLAASEYSKSFDYYGEAAYNAFGRCIFLSGAGWKGVEDFFAPLIEGGVACTEVYRAFAILDREFGTGSIFNRYFNQNLVFQIDLSHILDKNFDDQVIKNLCNSYEMILDGNTSDLSGRFYSLDFFVTHSDSYVVKILSDALDYARGKINECVSPILGKEFIPPDAGFWGNSSLSMNSASISSHIHTAGSNGLNYYTVVYYPFIPLEINSSNSDGWLEVDDMSPDSPNKFIQPLRHTLSCFPSWMSHKSIPIKSDTARVSLNIDFFKRLSNVHLC